MKIAVLNGSPKGDMSVTLRYVKYMEMKNAGHSFDVLNIAGEINKIEKDDEYFRSIIGRIEEADAVLWSFPVYYMLVPSQYKKFIEMLFEKNTLDAFKGKYAASISTSVHYMDQIAHNYIHAVSEDLGMLFFDYYSSHMNDLLDGDERKKIEIFTSLFLDAVERRSAIQPAFGKNTGEIIAYSPVTPVKDAGAGNLKVHVVTDEEDTGSNICRMIERLSASFGGNVKRTQIDDIGMKGGCLGCCRCAFENKCVYNDGFCDWFRNELLASDIIVFAGNVKDRFISSGFKQMFDRSFFLGHTPKMKGKTIGYMVSGNLQDNGVLREFFTVFTHCGGMGAGIAISDECSSSEELDEIIDSFARELSDYAKKGYIRPHTFYTVGGHKIFRDMIWGSMRPIFRADHHYYKKNKLYDFPQYDLRMRLERTFMWVLLGIPRVRGAVLPRMKEHMVKPLDKVLGSINN